MKEYKNPILAFFCEHPVLEYELNKINHKKSKLYKGFRLADCIEKTDFILIHQKERQFQIF